MRSSVLLLLCCVLCVSGASVSTELLQTAADLSALMVRLGNAEVKLNAAESEISTLRNITENRNKIAFSASLIIPTTTGLTYQGWYYVETIIVYRNIFTNLGSAYNPSTGIFTAPVRGIYQFNLYSFSWFYWGFGMSLNKNGQRVATIGYDNSYYYPRGAAGNSATLTLEIGDQVYVTIWAGAIADSDQHLSSFHGFLVATM